MAKPLGWLKEKREKRGRSYRYYLYGLINEITDKIETLMECQGLSKKELAERLGVSKASVSRILSGNRNMTLDTLVKVSFALGYRPRIEFERIAPEPVEAYNLREIDIEDYEVSNEDEALRIA